MKNVEHDGILMARVVSVDECANEANFLTDNTCPLQIGLFRYEANHVIQNHIHHTFLREVEKTCEMLLVLKGGLRANIFTSDKILVDSVNVAANEMIFLFEGGHGFEVTHPGTVILESKNGPYFGVEKDKAKF